MLQKNRASFEMPSFATPGRLLKTRMISHHTTFDAAKNCPRPERRPQAACRRTHVAMQHALLLELRLGVGDERQIDIAWRDASN